MTACTTWQLFSKSLFTWLFLIVNSGTQRRSHTTFFALKTIIWISSIFASTFNHDNDPVDLTVCFIRLHIFELRFQWLLWFCCFHVLGSLTFWIKHFFAAYTKHISEIHVFSSILQSVWKKPLVLWKLLKWANTSPAFAWFNPIIPRNILLNSWLFSEKNSFAYAMETA